MAQSQEYLKREFVHHISSTLALLGASEDFIKRIRGVEELPFTTQIIEDIKNFNVQEIDKVKTRLDLIYKTEIHPKG